MNEILHLNIKSNTLDLPEYNILFELTDIGILDIYAITLDNVLNYWHVFNTTSIKEYPPFIENELLVSINILKATYDMNGNLSDKEIDILQNNNVTVTKTLIDRETANQITIMSGLIYNPNYEVTDGFELKMAEINDAYNEAFNLIVINYPTHEIASFPMQEEQARIYLQDPTSEVKFLRTLHAGRTSRGYNETLEELCQKILYKSNIFEPVSGYLSGIRQAMEKELETIIDKVNNNEITSYQGYKACMDVEVSYPILTEEDLINLINPS